MKEFIFYNPKKNEIIILKIKKYKFLYKHDNEFFKACPLEGFYRVIGEL